ncbi:MAG: 3-phosphoshikimate 1-carboxyvinyltransferase [Flavobacteriales bacterium]
MIRILDRQYQPLDRPSFRVPVAKSPYNRHRILCHLASVRMPEEESNLPDDCRVLNDALSNNKGTVYLGQGGTSLRFYLATRLLEPNPVKIEVDEQLKKRPIKPLIVALRQLGLEFSDDWPLNVRRINLPAHFIQLDPSQSSQFISALALVAPFLENGLEIEFIRPPASESFLKLTLSILKEWNVSFDYQPLSLRIKAGHKPPSQLSLEGDWSSASYIILGAALRQQEIIITNLNLKSNQPDSALKNWLPKLGMSVEAHQNGLIFKPKKSKAAKLKLDFSTCPDLAPTLCIWHVMTGNTINFTGLGTLNDKESRRLDALISLLKDLNLNPRVKDDALFCVTENAVFPSSYVAESYGDHRLVMAFCDLSLRIPEFYLSETQSVTKSFPEYWKQMACWKIASK